MFVIIPSWFCNTIEQKRQRRDDYQAVSSYVKFIFDEGEE